MPLIVGAQGLAEEAGAAARENWSTLGRLLHLDEGDEATDDGGPAVPATSVTPTP